MSMNMGAWYDEKYNFFISNIQSLITTARPLPNKQEPNKHVWNID